MKSMTIQIIKVMILLVAMTAIAVMYANSETIFKKTLFSMPRPQKYKLDIGRVYFGNEIVAMINEKYELEILNPNTSSFESKDMNTLTANNRYEIEDIIQNETDGTITLKIRNMKGE